MPPQYDKANVNTCNKNAYNHHVKGIPIYDDDATAKAGNKRFLSSGYQDLWAAQLYIFGVLCLIVGAVVFCVNMHNEAYRIKDYQVFSVHLPSVAMTFGASGGAAIILTTLCLVLMHFFPTQYIIIANLTCILAMIGNGLLLWYFFSYDALYQMIICFIVAAFHLIWFCLAWNRIPLAAVLLSFATKLIFQYPMTLFISLAGFLLHIGHLLLTALCLACVYSFAKHEAENSGEEGIYAPVDSSTNPFLSFLLVLVCLMWYWGGQVISNVVHVTVAGVAATVYFLGTCMPSNPTWKSFVRATTTSFGSICFGSLLVAAVQMVRSMLRQLRSNRSSILALFADCLMKCIEQLLQFFNDYAFAYLAIYGECYLSSAKKAWNLIKNATCAVVFNDALLDYTLCFTSLLISMAVAGGTYLISSSTMHTLVAGIWGLLVSFLYLRVISSNILALFVCVAEAPDALQYSEPDVHAKIHESLRALSN